MIKNILSKLIIFLETIFFISTIVLMFIIYKKIESSLVDKFILIYIILLVLCSLSLIIIAIMNIKTLRWDDIRRRLSRFIIIFISFTALSFILSYIFNIDLWSKFSVTLGSSIGITFYDLMFIRKNED